MTPLSAALAMALRKRRLLRSEDNRQAVAVVSRAGVHATTDLRRWLKHAPMPRSWSAAIQALLPDGMPTAFGNYVCLCHLAQGGMGEIWLAQCQGRLVVVKTVRRELSDDLEFVRRFQREATIMQALRDERVVASLDQGVGADGLAYLVIEAVPGPDLKVLVRERGGLDEAHALRYLRDAACGLMAVHRAGFVHRDLKPANLLIDGGRDLARLSDFGVARSTREDRTKMTRVGCVVGSHNYMSPEQIDGRGDEDIRSDIYGLGGVLYFAVTAKPPYLGTAADVMHQHCTAPPPDPREFVAHIRAGTAEVIARCMAKSRKDRYSDPEALVRAIDALVPSITQQPPVEVRPPHLSSVRPASDPGLHDLRIALQGVGHPATVVLCAGRRLVMGKLVGGQVDVCLRYHPIADFHERLGRLSRQHLALAWDEKLGGMTVEDLHSRNGTWLDGRRIARGGSVPLPSGTEHELQLAQVMRLLVRCHTADPADGVVPAHSMAGVTVRRPDNRPGLAYALIMHRLTIGGEDAHLPISGARRNVTLCLGGGEPGRCWLFRSGSAPWRPLGPGTDIDLDGVVLRAGVFDEGMLADDRSGEKNNL